MRSWSWPVAALALIALVVGCESSGPADPTIAYQRLSLAEKAIDVGVNETQQLTLSSTPISGSVSWQSTNPSVATVSNGGLVSGRSIGTSKIVAAFGRSSDTATVTVHAAVAKLAVSPDSATVLVGQTMQLSFSASDKTGKTITGLSGSSAKWSSSDPTVATVSSTGAVQGIASGTAAISLTISGRSSTAFLRVSPQPVDTVIVSPSPTASVNVGSPLTLKATAQDATGQPLSDWIVVWSSSDSSVATVSSAGAVSSYKVGRATITASAGGKQAQTTVITNPAVVASVIVAVNASTIQIGQTTQAAATAFDSAGNAISGRAVTWASTKPSVASVSSLGVITGVDTGTAKITATVDGITGSATENVGGATIANLSVTLDKSTIPVGSTAQATAVATDGSGNVLTGRTVTWASSNTSLATVSNLGVVSAAGAGTVSISGTVDGKTASATLVVTSPTVASVTVTAAVTTLGLGQSTQATAVLKDASGNIVTAPVTWSSSAPAIASVSNTGLVTAIAAGNATITATSGTPSGSMPMTVSSSTTWPTTPVATLPELPRVVPLGRDPYAGKSCTVNVPAGGDVNAAVASARGGAVICPAMGASYGTLNLPARAAGDTGYIEIRGGTLPEGTRVTPVTAANFPKFLSPVNAGQAVLARASASGYVLRGLELATGPNVTMTYQLVQLGSGGTDQNTVALLPGNILLEQVYVHTTSTAEMQRCVQFNGKALAIVDSWVAECHGTGYDAQAVGGWSGTGPYLIANNYLEGSGENILFGGAAPIADGLVAYDITITRNWIRKPKSWIGSQWSIKNLLELKTAHRVLIEGNVLEGSWAQGQTGYGVMLKSSADAPYRYMNTEDVTVRNNYVTHVGAGFSITGRENYSNPSIITLYPQDRTQRILIENNKADTINVGQWLGDGRLFFVGGVQSGVADLTIRNNTTTSPNAGLNGFLVLTSPSAPAVDRFDFDANLVSEGSYGLFTVGGSNPLAGFNLYAAPNTFNANILVRESYVQYPFAYNSSTTIVSSGYADAFALAGQTGAGANQASVAAATQGVVTP